MSTYIMLGKYTPEGIENISAERTEQAVDIVKQNHGIIKMMYVMLGEYDMILVVDFPGIKEAMKVSLILTRLTGIAFATSEAISVKDFDSMAL